MKKLRTIIGIVLIIGMGLTITSCYGKFALTKKVYEFNNSMGDKFVKEAVFLAFVIIPVYEVAAFVDAIVLNLVEFWTGNNPLSLKEGMNIVNINGQNLSILLEKDNAIIYDKNMKEMARLNYNENDHTWYSSINGTTQKLMTIGEENVTLYTMTGKAIEVEKNQLNNKNTLLKVQEEVAMRQ